MEKQPMSLHWRSVLFGLILGCILITAAGKASAYTRARHIVYTVFPRQTEQAALRVVACETGHTYNPFAYNPSGAIGLFQIMGFHVRDPRRLFNPWVNARVAYRLSRGGWDWSQWTCKP